MLTNKSLEKNQTSELKKDTETMGPYSDDAIELELATGTKIWHENASINNVLAESTTIDFEEKISSLENNLNYLDKESAHLKITPVTYEADLDENLTALNLSDEGIVYEEEKGEIHFHHGVVNFHSTGEAALQPQETKEEKLGEESITDCFVYKTDLEVYLIERAQKKLHTTNSDSNILTLNLLNQEILHLLIQNEKLLQEKINLVQEKFDHKHIRKQLKKHIKELTAKLEAANTEIAELKQTIQQKNTEASQPASLTDLLSLFDSNEKPKPTEVKADTHSELDLSINTVRSTQDESPEKSNPTPTPANTPIIAAATPSNNTTPSTTTPVKLSAQAKFLLRQKSSSYKTLPNNKAATVTDTNGHQRGDSFTLFGSSPSTPTNNARVNTATTNPSNNNTPTKTQ